MRPTTKSVTTALGAMWEVSVHSKEETVMIRKMSKGHRRNRKKGRVIKLRPLGLWNQKVVDSFEHPGREILHDRSG
jgi:hypothetical protein